jgi:fructokinase
MTGNVLAYGEVLWDLLPDGAVLGGAPFNFASRINELGLNALMISAVGIDELGDRAQNEVGRLGLSSDFIQCHKDFPTGTVAVRFDSDGQPDYEIIRNVAYDHITFDSRLHTIASRCHCLCFGTLAQRAPESRATLGQLLDLLDPHEATLKVLDINLRKDCYTRESICTSLERASVLKLNEDEAIRLSDMFGYKSLDLIEIGNQLVLDWSLAHCVLTLGAQGALCLSPGTPAFYDPGYEVAVADPLGSGDAFTAAFVHQLLMNRSAVDACRFGNVLGALVATRRGATAPITADEIQTFLFSPPDRILKPGMEMFTQTDVASLQWKN